MRTYIQHTSKIFLLSLLTLLVSGRVNAQVLWSSPSSTAWFTAANWTGGSIPGTTQIAAFGVNPTGSATVTITMSSGLTNNGAANQAVGAIHDTTTRTSALTLTNSAGATNGTLTLNGATVSGVSNVVLANYAANTSPLTLANGTSTMDVAMLTGSKTIITGAGSSSSTAGNTINITSKITGTAALTFLGNGTWNGSTGNLGGILRWGNAGNTFAGGVTVGNSDGTSNGIFQLDNAGAISNTSGNNISINPFSQLYVATAGTYTTGNITLSLKGNGNNYATTGTGALFFNTGNYTWTGPISMSSNAVIASTSTNSANAVSLQGAISQTGGNTIITGAGTTSAMIGSTINITGIVSGSGASDTILGRGTWNGSSGVVGGLVKLGAANTYTGGTIVGKSDGTSNGILETTVNTAFSNTSGNNITINPFSTLYLNSTTADVYTTGNFTLNLNGQGNPATYVTTAGALVNANGKSFTWSGPVNFTSDARIAVVGNSTLTLSGNLSGSGALIKTGSNGGGNLIISGTANTNSGGVQVLNGPVIVSSGSSLGTGGLSLANGLAAAANMTVTLNNATQTITSLSSSWVATTGTATQNLVLSGTHVLTINQTTNTTYGCGAVNTLNSIISGATAQVIKAGSGRITFTGFTGGTAWFAGGLKINAGEVRFNPCSTMTVGAPDTLNGGALSTVGDTSVVAGTIQLGTLVLSDNSTINLETGISHNLKFAASATLGWTSGKVLTVYGWQGAFTSTSGTKGKLFIGTNNNTSVALSTAQLAQIVFVDGSSVLHTAAQLGSGEVVPTATTVTINTITTTASSYGTPYCNNISNGVSVAYTTSGTFTSPLFKVQLSNASGTFTADTVTGIIGSGTTSPISATIAAATATGTLYRIRVIHGGSTTYGSDNGSNLTINAIPSMGSITGGSTVTTGNTLALSCTPGGGTWSTSNAGVASINASTGLAYGTAAGSCTITYTATNGCGSNTATLSFTVTNSSITTTASAYASPYCNNTSNGISVPFTSSGTFVSDFKAQISDASGTFTADTVTGIIGTGATSPISATLPVSFATGSGYRIRVINGNILTYGSDNGSNITVNALPSMGTISGGSIVDVGSTINLSCTPGGGTWTTSAAGTASVNASTGVVTGVGVGSCTITYTATNTCGSSYVTQGITVNAARSLTTTAAGFGPFCNSTTNGISVAFTSAGTFGSPFKVQLSDASGTFTADTTTNIIGVSMTSPISATIPASIAAGTLYRVRVINGLPSPFYGTDNGSDITIAAPLSAGAITGGSSVLQGATVVLSSTPSGGTWSSSAPSVATINASTGSTYGASVGSSTITYTVSNTCGTSSSTLAFSVTNGNLYISAASPTWLTGANWQSGAKPTSTQIALFNTNPTSAATGVGINMNTVSGNEYVGAIFDSARTNNLIIGNSSTAVNGVLHFSNATIAGVNNAVLGNVSSTLAATLTLQSFQGTNGGQTFGLDFGSTPKTIVAGVGTNTAFGNIINISSATVIDTALLSFYGNGTWDGYAGTGSNGGLLKLGAANPFFGGIAVGKTDSTQSGTLELDNVSAISNVTGNDITVNPNSQLFLNTAGTYTTGNINLNLNGRGNNVATTGFGALVTNTGSFTWTGPIAMSNNTAISALGSFTMAGTTTQAGTAILVAPAGINSITPGNAITVNGILAGASGADTILGNGTWNGSTGNAGGIVKLRNTNTNGGGYVVGRGTAPYSSAILELDVNTAIANTTGNDITVNPYSELYLNSTSGDTYTTNNITLNLNGTGVNALGSPIITSSGGALVAVATAGTFTWTGPVNLASDARISPLNSTTIALTGNVGGSGALIKGGNNLNGVVTLSGTGNTWSGGTQISAGHLVVASGSALGNGVLSLNPTVTSVSPKITFNNAAQTITSISSTHPASGTQANTIAISAGHTLTFNLTSDCTFGSGAVSTLTSVISGAGRVVKDGSTRLTLGSGGTFFTGGLKINAGEIRFNPTSAVTMASADTLNGGTISTVGDTSTVSDLITMGTLALTNNSNIDLETSIFHRLKFTNSSTIAWTSGKTLVITGWKGGYNSTTGTKGQVFVGTTTGGLTAGQLAQVQFIDTAAVYHDAVLLSTGELVPKASSITTTNASFGPFCAGTSNGISVAFASSGSYTGNFKVQISNASGLFPSDTTTDIIGTGSASPISATISGSYAAGSGYRVRVISGTPLVFGSDNGNNINLTNLPTMGTIVGSSVTIGSTSTLTCTPGGGTWSSSTPSIATINPSTGVVYGVSVGTCTISYAVTNVCGTSYATETFSVDNHPVITSLVPSAAKVGDTVTINGNYFNGTAANNIVYFGATRSSVVSATTTLLKVVLDTSASFGPISVLNTGNSLMGFSKPFTPTYYNNYFINDTLSFKPKVDLTVGTNPNIAATGDFDGDGRPDIIVTNTNNGAGTTLTLFRNISSPGSLSTSSFTNLGTLTSGSGPTNVKVVDLDGDGKLDIVCANTAGGSVSAFRNTSSGPGSITFDAARNVSTVSSGLIGAQPVVVAIADYDNDGKPDIAVSSAYTSSNTISVIRNKTTTGATFSGSSFATALTFATGTTPLGLCTGDFDGDGLPDLAAVCSASNVVSIFLNTGSIGTISFATRVDSNTGVTPIDVATGDIDGDGKPDLVFTNAGLSSTNFAVMRNTSSGAGVLSFATNVGFSTGTSPAGVGLADFNGDGKLDVAIVEAGTDKVSVFRNTATSGTINSGSFATRLTAATGSGPTGIAINDLDGDGYPDIITGNKATNTISIIRNYPLPKIAAIGGTLNMCEAGGTTTLTNDTTGGTWSFSNGNATINPATGLATGVTAGLDTAYYAISRGGDTNRVMAVITVKPLPVVAAIGGPSGVCPGATIVVTNDTLGGTWAMTNTTLATVSVTGTITGITPGLDTVTYMVTTAGCSTTVFAPITINVLPNAGVISGTSAICAGATTALSSTGDAGGTWSSSNAALATVNPSTGLVTGIAAGTPMITYSVTNGCGTAFDTIIITVNPLPDTGIITGTSTVCVGATTALADTAVGGTWSSSNTGIATVSGTGVVTGVAAGTVTISYTVTNGCGTLSATRVVTVNGLPATPGPITGITSVCYSGGTTTLSDTTAGGTWSTSNAALASVDAATGIVTGVAVGTPNITYTIANSCGTNYSYVTVNVVGSPSATISSAVAPCIGYATNIVFSGTNGDTVGYQIDGGTVLNGVIASGVFSFSTGVIVAPHTYRLHNVRNAGCTTTIDIDTVITPLPMVWVGGTTGYESDWSTASNWSCGAIPAVTDDITIGYPTSYYPVVAASSTVNARNVTIASGASLTINSAAILNVKGNVTNNGTVAGAGTFAVNNNSAQSVDGVGTVNNLQIDNAAGATIGVTALVTVKNVLTVTSGTLTTNNNLVLYSDSAATARIATIPTGGAVSGNVKVMTYFGTGRRAYRFWAHPFSTYIALSQMTTTIDITGIGGITNGFTNTATNAPSAFRYNPVVGNSSASSDPGWRAFTSAFSTADSNRLHRYQGIRLFYRGAKGEGLGYGAYTPGDTAVEMTGPVNQGPQTVTLTKGASVLQDYNMVGNPYPAPVDAGAVITAAKVAGNINGITYYIWNPYLGAAGQFQAMTINTTTPVHYYMQACNALQVRAAHNNDTLHFEESDKSANTSYQLFKAAPEYIGLTIYDANYHPWDMLQLQFNDGATDKEDNDYDGGKPVGGDLSFYSLSADNNKLAVDGRPFTAGKVIPLGITSSYAQDFIIKAENVKLPQGGKLYLHDKLLKQFVALQEGTEYRFNIASDKTTQGENRFELSMNPDNVQVAVKSLQVAMVPNPATEEVKISFTAAGKEKVGIRVLDLSGVSIYNKDLGTQQNGTVIVPLSNFAAGVYMVELTSGNEKVVQRLIKE